MPNRNKPSLFDQLFFAPLFEALKHVQTRQRRAILSEDWLLAGVTRILNSVASGRDFLQRFGPEISSKIWESSTYFESLKSKNRLEELQNLNAQLQQRMNHLPDRLASLSELKDFEIYAGDGHWHQHATHDPKKPRGEELSYYATGHLYGINLRTRAMVHLTHCDETTKRKEHDMGALKRLDRETLRQGAKKGKKVLWIWDPAGLDYRQWYNWKQSAGIYFLCRATANCKLDEIAESMWDREDPINAGVIKDGLIVGGPQVPTRVVIYEDPISGKRFEFVTNLMAVSPGIIAQLYRMRWDIEKSFDVLKNKLMEKKAWATSSNSKSIQANFLVLAMNLITLFEAKLDGDEGIRNEAELKRKQKREDDERKQQKKLHGKIPILAYQLSRITQTSVKFVRWICMHLWRSTPWEVAVERLRRIYATL